MYKHMKKHYMFKPPRNKFLYFDYFIRYRHLRGSRNLDGYNWKWIMNIYELDLVSDIKFLLFDKLIKLAIQH